MEHAELHNITVEVTLIEPWARFNGVYSDVYIGQFRGERVRLSNAPANEHEANVSLQVAVKVIRRIRHKPLETMQRVSN